MRTLILGCKGQLGRDFMSVFGEVGEIVGHDLPELDIADMAAVQQVVSDAKPDLIVNSAAYTNVEGAEDDEENAYLANEKGAANVAEAAKALDVPVVLISTDFVFDGTKTTPYEPDDAPSPVSVYGRSKLAGEIAVQNTTPKHFIIRTAWLYGPGGNNFPEKILAAARKNPSLKVVHDEIGSPTHTWDLALATRALSKTESFGTYHAVNTGFCERDTFAKAILDRAGIDTPVAPCSATEFPTKAQRPAYSVLSVEKLESVTDHRIRTWEEALDHYMSRR